MITFLLWGGIGYGLALILFYLWIKTKTEKENIQNTYEKQQKTLEKMGIVEDRLRHDPHYRDWVRQRFTR